MWHTFLMLEDNFNLPEGGCAGLLCDGTILGSAAFWFGTIAPGSFRG